MNTITKEFLESEIVNVEYQRGKGTLTHCYITVKSGFVFTGESACADPANFNEEFGQKFAYEDAFNKMWLPYGFALKKKIGGDFAYRLHNERDELEERAGKLAAFLPTENFAQLPEEQRTLLQEQHIAMTQYLHILDKRIELLWFSGSLKTNF